MANKEAKATFRANTEEFDSALRKSAQEMKELRSEAQLADAQLRNDASSATAYESKLAALDGQLAANKAKQEALNGKLQVAETMFGRDSTEATNLRVALNRAATEEERIKSAIKNANSALNEQRTAAQGAGDALQSIASSELASQITDVANAMGQLVDSTREYREDIAKLDTAFTVAGFSAEAARETYQGIFAFTGEEDRSVEAAQRLAQMVDTEQQLNQWLTILQGAWGVYGDSLPIEGLAESANETKNVGKVTGVLADALNWAGVSEDSFNESLAACNDEAEREKLIRETLLSLYTDAAGIYSENAESIMENRQAQYELAEAQSNLATKMEPVYTMWTNIKAAMVDFVAAIPTPVLTALIVVLGVAAVALTALSIAAGVMAAATWVLNSALLANPITWVVLAIVALIAIIVALIANFDTVKAVVLDLWDTISATFTAGIDFVVSAVTGFVDSVIAFFTGLWGTLTGVASGIWASVSGAFSGGVESAISFVASLPWRVLSIFAGVGSWLVDSGRSLIQGFIDGVTGAIDWAADTVSGALERIWNLFPHSPAKEGPFSGKGWTLYSGMAIAESLGEGFDRQIDKTIAKVNQSMGSLHSAVSVDAGSALSGRTTNIYINGARINDDSALEDAAYRFLTELNHLATTEGVA